MMKSATSECLVRHVRVLMELRLIWRKTCTVLGYLQRKVEICAGVSEKKKPSVSSSGVKNSWSSRLFKICRYVVPKRRYGITNLRCVISQKTTDILYLAVEA